MELFKSGLNRVKKNYRAATMPLFPDSAPESKTTAARERGREQGTWNLAPQSKRAAATMEKPAETKTRFISAAILGNPLSDGVSVRKISEDCEREARRYESKF